jgi:hypothetical protein
MAGSTLGFTGPIGTRSTDVGSQTTASRAELPRNHLEDEPQMNKLFR